MREARAAGAALALVPAAAGLAWLGLGARAGWGAFLVALLPGVALLTGGVASAWLAGELRGPSLVALGGIAGVVLAPLAAVLAGVAVGVGLLVGSAASVLACGLASALREGPQEGVPAPRAGVRLALELALDEANVASLFLGRRAPLETDPARLADEVRRAYELFATRGWLSDPARYHRAPSPLVEPECGPRGPLGVVPLCFESGYAPRESEPGRERWLSYAPDRTAWAWLLRSDARPRPWLLCLHGYGMGFPRLDLRSFHAHRLHEELGMNVLLPVLPLHGPRRVGLRSGDRLLGGDTLDTVHGLAEAIFELRRLVGWARSQGATRIGVHGVSLGGYVAALLAMLEPDLDMVIAGMPPTDLARIGRRFTAPGVMLGLERAGLDLDAVDALLRVVSPLALPPLVPPGGRFLYAAAADRIVSPDQVLALHAHWEHPPLLWYPGAHVTFRMHPAVRAHVRDALEKSGFAAPPDLQENH